MNSRHRNQLCPCVDPEAEPVIYYTNQQWHDVYGPCLRRPMNPFKAVEHFWSIGHPEKIKDTPGIPSDEISNFNMRLIREEIKELERGVAYSDIVEIADALADTIYVVIGMAVSHGIPIEEVFTEVHRTNMAKFPNGKVIRRSDGKILKPDDWEPPNIKAILNIDTTGTEDK